MSLLNGSTQKTTEQGNKWAGRVHCLGAVPVWWQSATTIGVAEVDVAGVITLIVHINRSQKTGKLYCSAPATKKGEEWQHLYALEPELDKAVSEAALAGWKALDVRQLAQAAD